MSTVANLKQKLLNLRNDKTFIKQALRYLIVGFSTFFLEYILFIGFLIILTPEGKNVHLNTFINDMLNLNVKAKNYLSVNSCVFFIVFWFNFLLNRFWSFESKEKFITQVLKYLVLFVFNLVFGNILLLYFFTSVIGIPVFISKVIMMIFIVSWNFIIYKKVIYT